MVIDLEANEPPTNNKKSKWEKIKSELLFRATITAKNLLKIMKVSAQNCLKEAKALNFKEKDIESLTSFLKDSFEVTKAFINYCFLEICEQAKISPLHQKHFLGFEGFYRWKDVGEYKKLGWTASYANQYFIQLNHEFLQGGKFNFDRLIDTIAHELAHVRQLLISGASCCSNTFLSTGEKNDNKTTFLATNEHKKMWEENTEIIKNTYFYNKFKFWWNKNINE